MNRRDVELTGDDVLGPRVGAAQHPTSWGLIGFALMACDTLEQSILTGVKYQNLSGATLAWSALPEEEGLLVRVELPVRAGWSSPCPRRRRAHRSRPCSAAP
ncbi:AraC family transcriptional regulator ligand-binding domain-containing protein [Streptomyces griseorubiginosus]|uniref:AraC family transcriptional regulator ligand-binding domain-containing protein n=1 Tax=Streptomyces griseorubiginosus TaxID=67304 RepID=UPI003625A60D